MVAGGVARDRRAKAELNRKALIVSGRTVESCGTQLLSARERSVSGNPKSIRLARELEFAAVRNSRGNEIRQKGTAKGGKGGDGPPRVPLHTVSDRAGRVGRERDRALTRQMSKGEIPCKE